MRTQLTSRRPAAPMPSVTNCCLVQAGFLVRDRDGARIVKDRNRLRHPDAMLAEVDSSFALFVLLEAHHSSVRTLCTYVKGNPLSRFGDSAKWLPGTGWKPVVNLRRVAKCAICARKRAYPLGRAQIDNPPSQPLPRHSLRQDFQGYGRMRGWARRGDLRKLREGS